MNRPQTGQMIFEGDERWIEPLDMADSNDRCLCGCNSSDLPAILSRETQRFFNQAMNTFAKQLASNSRMRYRR